MTSFFGASENCSWASFENGKLLVTSRWMLFGRNNENAEHTEDVNLKVQVYDCDHFTKSERLILKSDVTNELIPPVDDLGDCAQRVQQSCCCLIWERR